MTYVVARLCRDKMDTSCVNVCPVDCFYFPKEFSETYPSQIYISPSECIDCGACDPECPWETIFEGDTIPDAFKEEDTALNALCDSDRDNFETATHTDKPRPTADEVAENKKKWACKIGSNQKGVATMGTFHKAAETKDLAPGNGMAVEVGGHKIALFNVDGDYYAIGDTCTHKGGPLSEGALDGTTVTCPWHGANFDLSSGKNLTPPAPQEVPSYTVRVEGNDIQVEIP